MNDQRFNSLHLEASPRREDFRKARARLLGMCGQHTLMCDQERWAELAEAGPHTLIERPGEPPLRAGMTAYVSIDTRRSRSLAKIFGSGDAAAAKP